MRSQVGFSPKDATAPTPAPVDVTLRGTRAFAGERAASGSPGWAPGQCDRRPHPKGPLGHEDSPSEDTE